MVRLYSLRSGSYLFRVGRSKLIALQAGAFKKFVPRHHNVTAAITLVPRSAFACGHQFEITTLNTIRAGGFIRGPKRRGEGHTNISNTNYRLRQPAMLAVPQCVARVFGSTGLVGGVSLSSKRLSSLTRAVNFSWSGSVSICVTSSLIRLLVPSFICMGSLAFVLVGMLGVSFLIH